MYLLHSRTVFAKCKPGEGDRRLPDEIWGPGMSPSCLLTPPDTLVRVFDALSPKCFLKICRMSLHWWFTMIFFATNLFGHLPLDRNTNDCQLILRNGLLWRTFYAFVWRDQFESSAIFINALQNYLALINWVVKPIDYWCLIDVLIALPESKVPIAWLTKTTWRAEEEPARFHLSDNSLSIRASHNCFGLSRIPSE